jgi:hypothetical protein
MRYKVWSARELDDLAGTPFDGGEGVEKIYAEGGEGVVKAPGVGHDLRIAAAATQDGTADAPLYRFRYAGGAE